MWRKLWDEKFFFLSGLHANPAALLEARLALECFSKKKEGWI
jgi:hypothetical protein